MDLDFVYGCVVTLCLFSAMQCPNSEKCSCSELPTLGVKEFGPLMGNCQKEPMGLRYACKDGYKRKAGTSNLLKCGANSWIIPGLECIPDPNPKQSRKKTTLVPPTTTIEPSIAITTSSGPNSTARTPSMVPTASKSDPNPKRSRKKTTLVPPTTTIEPSIAITTSSGPNSTARTPSMVPTASKLSGNTTTAVVVSCGFLVILMFSVGIGFLCYRRRRLIYINVPVERAEDIPMSLPS